MLNEIILDKICVHPEMHKIAVEAQAKAVKAFEEVLEEMAEENPYATVTELLSTHIYTASISAEL